jgi:hypothetical protein
MQAAAATGDERPGASEHQAQISLCAVRDGRLLAVPGVVDGASGDTLVEGRPVAEVLPADQPPYAGKTTWYAKYEPVIYDGRRFLTEGYQPRRLASGEIEPVGEWRGVPLFAEAGAGRKGISVLYILLSPDCMFQPYPYMNETGSVRSE